MHCACQNDIVHPSNTLRTAKVIRLSISGIYRGEYCTKSKDTKCIQVVKRTHQGESILIPGLATGYQVERFREAKGNAK